MKMPNDRKSLLRISGLNGSIPDGVIRQRSRRLTDIFNYDTGVFFAIQLPRHWLVSARARRVYSICAQVGLFLFIGLYVFVGMALELAGVRLSEFPLLKWIVWALMVPGVVATAIVRVAMWFFWVRFHPPDSFGKGLWLLVLLLGSFGSFLYLVFVYRRSPLFKTVTSSQSVIA